MIRFAFDIGFSSIGYAVNKKYKKVENDLDIWAGVWLFDNENYKSELNSIKREKRRKKRKKERLKKIRKLLNIKLDESFKKHTQNVWKYIKKAKHKKLTQKEFNAIIYHFAKYRGYIDMRKIKKDNEDNKEEGGIKEALKRLDSFNGKNIFEKLLAYRDKLIDIAANNLNSKFNIDRKEAVEFLEYYMPYRNKNIGKLINKINEHFKLDIKSSADIFEEELRYYFILPNNKIIESIIDIVTFQKKHFNNELIQENSLKELVNLLSFKGPVNSLEDKIGWCESGFKYKRSGKYTFDAEKFRVIDLWKKLICIDKEGKEFFIKECMLFDEFYKRVTELNKEEITRDDLKKLLEDLNVKDFKQTNNKFLYLKAHKLYNSLKNRDLILSDDELRDKIEYTLLFYYDFEKRKEILRKYIIDENDLDMIAEHNIGKPSFLSNIIHREIFNRLTDEDLTAILNEYKEKNLTFLNRNYLSYKVWKQQTAYNNPYLENIIKHFIKLFNHLVQNFGTPDEIVIESARSFAISDKEIKNYKDYIKKQNQNELTNNMIKDFINTRFKEKPKDYGKLIKRLKLFLEQNKNLKELKDNSVSYCPLTGEIITIEDAIDGKSTNIDHIIPQSVVIDNSLNNIILISAKINQAEKKDMTPVEYIAKSKNISINKAKKILEENLKKTRIESKTRKYNNMLTELESKEFKYELKGFDLRHLQSTHFGVKEIKEIIIRQYHFNNPDLSYNQRAAKIVFTNGKLTSLLRKVFLPKYKKNRKYFINHLIDALVLLNIDRSMQQIIHTLANKFVDNKIYKQKEFINYIREEYFEKRNIKTKFDLIKAVEFFEEKFNNLELGAYREEVKKLKKRYFKETILSKKDVIKETSAIYTKSGYRTKDRGFKKILICKNDKGKLNAIFINYFDKKDKKCNNENILELYRYSLIKIKDQIGYVIGGSGNTIEIIPVNVEKGKNRIKISVSNFNNKLTINPLGVINNG